MRSVKWVLVGFAIGGLLLLLVVSGARSQDWCSDEAKVRERLERAIEARGEIEVIASCKRAVVPVLNDALKDENVDVRWRAANALGDIGPEAKDSVPALIDALKDKNSPVRGGAAFALGSIGPEAKDSVPALIDALKDSRVRSNAASALGGIGAEAKDSVPALIDTLKDENSFVRLVASSALERIAGSLYNSASSADQLTQAEKAITKIQQALKGTDFEESKQQVNRLLAALKDKQLQMQRRQ